MRERARLPYRTEEDLHADRDDGRACLEVSEALVRSRKYLPEGARVMELVGASSYNVSSQPGSP